MIDEDVLRRLLSEAAESVPPPGRAPEELLDTLASTRVESPERDRRRLLVPAGAVAAALLVAALLGNAIVGGDGGSSDRMASGRTEELGASESGDSLVATTVPGASQNYAADRDGAATQDQAASSTAGGSVAPNAVPKAVPTDGARVVKTGSLALEVRGGSFERTVDRITSLAVGLGGYVAESSTSEADEVPIGSITVRVPSASFEDLLASLRKLGTVESVTSKGTDVTAEFTDLVARLSALNATRERLLEVLRGARNVGDIIAVQDRITGVQTEIEQLQGQQRLLEDQAGFGTLAVTVAEPGAQVSAASEPEDGIGSAWRDARRHFGNAVEGLVEASGVLAVVVLVLLVLGALGWLGWRRGRRLFV